MAASAPSTRPRDARQRVQCDHHRLYVRPDAKARTIAEQEGVDIRLYRVIYNAIEDVRRQSRDACA
jgi:hypothetical protein